MAPTLSEYAPRGMLCQDSEEDPSLHLAEVLDRSHNYLLSRITLALSPTALAVAYLDRWLHLTVSPGKQLNVVG